MDLVDRLTVLRCCGLYHDEETSCFKEKVKGNPVQVKAYFKQNLNKYIYLDKR